MKVLLFYTNYLRYKFVNSAKQCSLINVSVINLCLNYAGFQLNFGNRV